MSDAIRKVVGSALAEIIESARSGDPKVKVGLMAAGSELGPEELARGARLARETYGNVTPVMIGPRTPGFEELEWIETPDCEADVASTLEDTSYPSTLGIIISKRIKSTFSFSKS